MSSASRWRDSDMPGALTSRASRPAPDDDWLIVFAGELYIAPTAVRLPERAGPATRSAARNVLSSLAERQ